MSDLAPAPSSSLWDTINSDDGTYVPFWFTLSVFSVTYLYCLIFNNAKKDRWNRWYILHNCHNGGAILLGTLSLLSSTSPNESGSLLGDIYVNERVPILWSLGYFTVDIVDCTVRRDWTYLFHGAACLVLGLANYQTPVLFRLKMNSKATYCELSNPLMHLAKTTRHPVAFFAFACVFTVCRMLWLPYMYRQCLDAGLPWTHPALLLLAAFYGLNCVWYVKIVRILVQGLRGRADGEKKKEH